MKQLTRDVISISVQSGNVKVNHLILLRIQSTIKNLVDTTQEFSYESISTGKILGYGGFGVVQLVNVNGKPVACKQMKSNDESDITYFRAELALIR